MAGYVYRGDKPISKEEKEAINALYNESKRDAERVLANARKQAHQIRQAALMEAERDAKAIREAAYAEGLAMANPEHAADEQERRRIGQHRLNMITNEIYGISKLNEKAER